MRLFDTSFIIDLSNADDGATKLAKAIDEESSVSAISSISVHEYILGIHIKYSHEKDLLKTKLASAERELTAIMILPLTYEIAMESARIHAALANRGRVIGINDIYIAATAIVHKADLVTRNSSHFEQVQGLSIQEY